MLIRILKKSKDMIEGKPHEPNQELTRRGFIASSATGLAASFVVPSIFQLLRTEEARAAAIDNGGALAEPIPCVSIQLSGGNGTTMMLPAWGLDGMPLVGNSNALGTQASDTINQSLITGMYTRIGDMFETTLRAGAGMMTAAKMAEILGTCSGSQIAGRNGDDTSDNPDNANALINTLVSGRNGQFVGSGANNRSLYGGRNDFPLIAAGGSVANLTNSMKISNTGVASAAVGNSYEKAVNALKAAQGSKLTGQVGSGDFMANMTSGLALAKIKFDPAFADATFNPENAANLAILSTVFTNVAGLSNEMKLIVSMVMAACKGEVAAVNLVKGGFDYHDNTFTTGQNKHAEIANMVAAALGTAHAFGRKLYIGVNTDGGISFEQGTRNALGDRGSSNQDCSILKVKAGQPKISTKAVGSYSALVANGGGEASQGPAASRPENKAIVHFMNFGFFSGRLNTSNESMQAALNLVNLKGTLVPGGVTDLMKLFSINT